MKVGDLVRRRRSQVTLRRERLECGVVVESKTYMKSDKNLIKIYMCGKVTNWKQALWYETVEG